jgi:MFS family permease
VRPRLPSQVIILGFVSLLNDAASEMIYPLLPVFLTATLGATPVVIGMIEGTAEGLASILKYFAGTWSDRLRRRKPLVVTGYALAAASRLLIGAASAWTAVLTARLIDRTGKGMRSAPRDAMISDVTPPENRGRAFGFHRALDHAGAIIGPLLAMALLTVVSMRQLFFIAVIPGFIGVLLLIIALREPERHDHSARRDAAQLQAGRLPANFWRAIAAIALFSLANSSDAFLILQAHAAGVSTAMLPLLWAAHHVVKSLFSTHAGELSDRIGRRQLLVAGWIAYAIIYLLFPSARSLPAFVALFVAYAIPFTLAEGAERALIGDLVPAALRGKSFGIYYLVNGSGVLLGSALFGVLYQTVSARAAFVTGAGLAIAAAVAISALRRSE